MINHAKHSRRNFCTAIAGSLLLPRLESFATPTTDVPPQRFVTLFFPNGVYPDAWQPKLDAGRLRLTGSLEPLAEFSSQANFFTGLDNPLGGHLGQTSGFLSGHDFAPEANGTIVARPSLDQMLAHHFADQTFLPSLNLAMEPPSQGAFGDRPRSFGNSISWSSATNKIEPQINPQQAFDEVFFGQSQAGRDAARRREAIVNEIWQQSKSLKAKISHLDRQRLQQYTDSIQDLQVKLRKTSNPGKNFARNSEIAAKHRPQSSASSSNYAEQMKLMMDIMLLALQTDSTRVATLVMGHSISRVVYDFADPKIRRNHHELSHHRNDPDKIRDYNIVTKWFASQTAYFLGRMSEIDEGNGSLLDNSVVMYGSGMKDGNVHEPKNIPVALFGNAGGRLQTGRHLTCPENSILSQLHLSLLRLFGIQADQFNQVAFQGIEGIG
ncbi:DUF1552 domain-containing protein [Stieleria sp. TO1_6]|uniref:DUF1552 domain-containing protein n=1 Tax=Stieleria tagensis TaxID=2956795 RepID=UPI00209AB2E6|nr:DUF1552 domain-containing protein [Stieleria tagensis]MCO8124565.1 DUF1552 domain-containing protein [Stieleria tagensis]